MVKVEITIFGSPIATRVAMVKVVITIFGSPIATVLCSYGQCCSVRV